MKLHKAASSGDTDTLNALLSEESNINARNDKWETPLYCACASGQLSAVRVLLEAGARINAKARKRFTPLHVAARFGHDDVVEELIRAGAAVDRETIRCMTPFLVAVKYSQKSCAECLLRHKSDIHAKDMFHRTALHWAIKTDQRDLFELLVSQGADVSITDKFSKTPIMQAVKSNRPELLKRLLELDADRTMEDKLLRRPIHVAALKGHCQCIDIFLQSGTVLPDSWNDQHQRMTPLMFAASHGQLESMKLLLERGADPNRVNTYNQTALCLVAIRRRPVYLAHPKRWCMVALKLIRANTDVNLLGAGPCSWYEGEQALKNALEMAFHEGYEDLVKVLAKAGSQVRNLTKLWQIKTENLPEFARKNLSLLDWLRWFYRSPRPLKELSRRAVLNTIPAPFFAKNLEELHLAPGIQYYMMFRDIEDPAEMVETTDTTSSESNTEEEMEPSVFDSDLYGDGEVHDTDEEQSTNCKPGYKCLP